MRHRHPRRSNRPPSKPAAPAARSPKPANGPAPSHGAPGEIVEGVLQKKPRFGFVLSENPARPDLFVAGPSLRLAMDGDRVRARVTRPGVRSEGEILEVLSRKRSTLAGVFRSTPKPCLVPEEGGEPVRVADVGGLKPKDGDLCVLRVSQWPDGEHEAAGTLIEVIGRRNDPAADLAFLLRKHELPGEFPPEVERGAAAFGDEVPPSAYQGRKTFFDVPVFTIDGADAKDFDDAVSLERRPGGGWRLGVHIADVAHYVTEGSALDQEAIRRGTSVYLSGAVIPMLPFPLSDNLCSLRPHVARLTLTCLMDLDPAGRVVHHDVFESVIRSARRFTYDEVELILQGQRVEVSDAVRDAVREMGELARTLRALRFGRGSLDFDFPEPVIIVDDKGWPIDACRKERGESHRLIEEFMLLANETVARHMGGGPFLYRIHERPDPAKMETLAKTLQAVGVAVPPTIASGKPAALRQVLESVKGKPVEPMVHTLTLRSLKQAVYSPVNKGHFGLASEAYTHFTSPIRRYPDLLVHRMVKERIHGRFDAARQSAWRGRLPGQTEESSRLERRAVEAEREFLALKRAQLMTRRVGETFDAVVTGVTAFGVFVQPTAVFVEGLVNVERLPRDRYQFDPLRLQLRGQRTNKSFRLGQAVRVRLAGVNVEKRELDFALEDAPPKTGTFSRRPR